MKRILIAIAAIALFIGGGSMFYLVTSSYNTGHVDGLKILAAATTYARSVTAQGLPVPASVSLQELIDEGLLAETDVAGLADVEVTVSLVADENRPQDVLVRARLPNGQEIVALGDGSVQQVKK